MKHLFAYLKMTTKPYLIFIAGLLLCACQKGGGYVTSMDDSFKLPPKVAGTSDAAVIAMQKMFNKCGVRVVTIGQDYLISIPSAALFTDQSPRLTWQSYALLNNVVFFLQQFRKVGVTVTSYSSKYVSVRREQALTLTRARVVADYLWSQGIDSRFVFTEGAGSDKPIASFAHGGDKSVNSRIEITFRDAIV